MKKYSEIKKVEYLGPESKEPFAFKYYNPDEVIAGKKNERSPQICYVILAHN